MNGGAMQGKPEQDRTLTLRRKGSFDVNCTKHNRQCGLYGEKTLAYDVQIEGRQIDCPRGYLLDNNDIPAYFSKRYGKPRTFEMCEKIASDAVTAFRDKSKTYGCKPNRIRVAISGIANSEIACDWQNRTTLGGKL